MKDADVYARLSTAGAACLCSPEFSVRIVSAFNIFDETIVPISEAPSGAAVECGGTRWCVDERDYRFLSLRHPRAAWDSTRARLMHAWGDVLGKMRELSNFQHVRCREILIDALASDSAETSLNESAETA